MSFAGVFAILAIPDFAVFNDFSFEIRAVKLAENISALRNCDLLTLLAFIRSNFFGCRFGCSARDVIYIYFLLCTHLGFYD